MWHSTNDGTGSGLDADTLDGEQGSYYYPASNPSGYQTTSGSVASATAVNMSANRTDSTSYPIVWATTGSTSQLYSHATTKIRSSDGTIFASHYRGSANVGGTGEASHHPAGIYSNGNNWLYGTIYMNNNAISGLTTINGGTPWTSSSDGPGTGLDADTLDGEQGSYYFSPVNFPNRTNFENTFNNLSSSTGGNADLNTTFLNDRSGFFDVWGGLAGSNNKPPGTTHVQGVQVRHSTSLDYGWQLASQYDQPGKMYLRHVSSGSFFPWHTMWTSQNDGAGSGLDADTLDSMQPKSSSGATGANQILRSHSNNYLYHDSWIQVGTSGLFSTTTNGAHFSPNNVTSYGTWRTDGARGGYDGIVFDSGGDVAIMYDSAGNGGLYRAPNGRWHIYHHVANNCLGIGGSTTSSAYSAYVFGALYATGNITAYSDRRVKENIVPIDNALEKVNQLEGVYYNRIDDPDKKREIGFIAQDVNDVTPELVTYAEDVDQYGVKYQNTTALLVEAVKTLTQQVKDLQAEIEEMKNA